MYCTPQKNERLEPENASLHQETHRENTNCGVAAVNFWGCTLPETNIAPEKGWLENEVSFWKGLFSRVEC